MKGNVNPDNLRKLAFVLEKCNKPDAVSTLRWAADDIEKLRKCVSLLSSVIKSGGPWSVVCDEMYKRAMGNEEKTRP